MPTCAASATPLSRTWTSTRSASPFGPGRGGPPPTPPGQQSFWAVSDLGQDATVSWDIAEGSWVAVVMNEDGSRLVAADLTFGARVGWLIWIAIGVLIAGLLVLAAGVVMIFFGARGVPATETAVQPPPITVPVDEYPVQIEGALDEPPQPLALAREMAPRDPARHRARLPVARVRRAHDRRVLRDPVHRPVSARRSSTSTSACSGGPGGSASTRTAPSAPTATRPSRSGRSPTTRRGSRSPIPSTSRAASRWSSAGSSPSRTTSSLVFLVGLGVGHRLVPVGRPRLHPRPDRRRPSSPTPAATTATSSSS